MYTLKVENNSGDILDFSETDDFKIFKINGLTPAAAIISTMDNVGYDGSVYSGSRSGSRNITIEIYPQNNIEESRQLLYNYFAPKSKVRLYFANLNRDCYIDGYVEALEADIFSEMQAANISIICPQPYFIKNEDPEHLINRIEDNKCVLTLNGEDVESGLVFDITLNAPSGRKAPIVIENETHGEIIRIKNTDAAYIGYYTISTVPGEKRAVYRAVWGGAEENIIHDVEVPLRSGGMVRQWVMLHPGENVIKVYIPGRTEAQGEGIAAKATVYRYYAGV